jgi:hypothetical protein
VAFDTFIYSIVCKASAVGVSFLHSPTDKGKHLLKTGCDSTPPALLSRTSGHSQQRLILHLLGQGRADGIQQKVTRESKPSVWQWLGTVFITIVWISPRKLGRLLLDLRGSGNEPAATSEWVLGVVVVLVVGVLLFVPNLRNPLLELMRKLFKLLNL